MGTLIVVEGCCEDERKKKTLTNLYNQRPTLLDLAHKRLDEAVFAAYGWGKVFDGRGDFGEVVGVEFGEGQLITVNLIASTN